MYKTRNIQSVYNNREQKAKDKINTSVNRVSMQTGLDNRILIITIFFFI